ncbi:MAG: hypothetical protein LBI54_09745 [Lachnospiraceae bacterium]|nr:hypothetical protein [Lachnospiraceae bacterium]
MGTTLITTTFLILGLLGYGCIIYLKTRIRLEFIPMFLFSSIMLLMLAAGLLNLMPVMNYAIVMTGMAFLGYNVRYITKEDLRQLVKDVSYHAITAEYYRKNYYSKSDEDLARITETFIKRTLDIENNVAMRNIVIWNFILTSIFLILKVLKKKGFRLLRILVFVDAVFVLYLAGMYFTYIFSIPATEGGWGSYDRYLNSIRRYLEGYLLIQLALAINLGTRGSDSGSDSAENFS